MLAVAVIAFAFGLHNAVDVFARCNINAVVGVEALVVAEHAVRPLGMRRWRGVAVAFVAVVFTLKLVEPVGGRVRAAFKPCTMAVDVAAGARVVVPGCWQISGFGQTGKIQFGRGFAKMSRIAHVFGGDVAFFAVQRHVASAVANVSLVRANGHQVVVRAPVNRSRRRGIVGAAMTGATIGFGVRAVVEARRQRLYFAGHTGKNKQGQAEPAQLFKMCILHHGCS